MLGYSPRVENREIGASKESRWAVLRSAWPACQNSTGTYHSISPVNFQLLPSSSSPLSPACKSIPKEKQNLPLMQAVGLLLSTFSLIHGGWALPHLPITWPTPPPNQSTELFSVRLLTGSFALAFKTTKYAFFPTTKSGNQMPSI